MFNIVDYNNLRITYIYIYIYKVIHVCINNLCDTTTDSHYCSQKSCRIFKINSYYKLDSRHNNNL